LRGGKIRLATSFLFSRHVYCRKFAPDVAALTVDQNLSLRTLATVTRVAHLATLAISAAGASVRVGMTLQLPDLRKYTASSANGIQ
jgi:hypothetical protein